jgi:ribose transport system permease protein
MGSDERAAYTSGVRITIVRIGAHCISGVFSALAALTYTALIGSGDPTQGTTYTLISVTALVLGGTSLAGGRGGVIGSLLGALNLFLIGYVLATFSFGAVQGFVTDLAYGVILVLSLLLTVAIPWIQTRIKNISPTLIFIVLSILFAGVILHAKYDYAQPAALAQEQSSSAVETTPAPDNQATQEAAPVPSQAPPVAAVPPVLVASPGHPAPTGFFLEGVVTSGPAATDSKLAKPIALIILLAVSLLIIARAVVLQTRQRRMSMRMVFVLVTALVLTAYLAWEYTTLPTQAVAIYDQIKEQV